MIMIITGCVWSVVNVICLSHDRDIATIKESCFICEADRQVQGNLFNIQQMGH